ncbi:MAG: diaminopimelate decarboxylase [Candidatus Kapaibacteriales bacterium]
MDNFKKIDFALIAQKFGTPIYIYDYSKIVENYTKLHSALKKYFPNYSIHYSIKANNNISILEVFKNLGAGVDCSSPVELECALFVGYDFEKIIYTGNYESYDDFLKISQYPIIVNFDDISSFRRYLKFRRPEIASFRVNPGIGKGGFEGITTGGTDAKFGIPYEMIEYAFSSAKNEGINKFGIHIMTGSNILEPFYFAEVLEKLFRIVGKFLSRKGITLEYIDVGGGFGIPYTDDEKELDIDFTFKLLSEVYQEFVDKLFLDKPKFIIEPGRYLIGNAGILLSRVTSVKDGYKKYIGIDAGMNTLIRPALYGANHRIEIFGKNNIVQLANFCGQICENSDILARNVPVPEVEVGDLVLIFDVGAYGFSMSSNYNGRLRPAELMMVDGVAKLIRRRETFDDFISTMRV